MRTVLALAAIVMSIFVLESARHDVDITYFDVGATPVTQYARIDADGPVVVVAHGFAGSQQMMQGYALPLARAGYRVFAFEFLGHGRHSEPMSGDVTTVDGTTRLLVDQTNAVIDAVADPDQLVAVLGHSMATDVLVRVAADRDNVGPIVLVSAFSQVIDADTPNNLLLITGAWEAGLRAFGEKAAQMVDPDASEGETVTNGRVTRRAIAAPFSEHVSVLHSRVGRAEALAWLDRGFARTSDITILPSGWAILGLLGGLVILFRPIAARLPQRDIVTLPMSLTKIAIATLIPMLVAPVFAVPLTPSFLPVLVADYLVLHLFIFGILQLALLWMWGARLARPSIVAIGLLLLWACVFGFALDRYAANFWPTSERIWIIAMMLIGAVPYMLADAVLTTSATVWRRLILRTGFLVSLGIAVALDFEGLFFLIMIAPVLALYYLVFGTMGRNVAARAGPVSSGLALGCVLAWALGVSFPLFAA